METILVNLPQGGYPIHVSTATDRDWTQSLIESLAGKKPILITSPRVARHCLPLLKKSFKKLNPKTLLLPDGEPQKNMKTVLKAYRRLIQLGADRRTPILLLGGGVIGDLGGFVASTYLRGIPFIQIGTTLVAQVDSSIGGKVGIDLPEGKNLVGTFSQPQAVYSHTSFLKTLPLREIVGGLGEVLKYGVIREPALFSLIRDRKRDVLSYDPSLLYHIVCRSSAIKAQVVSADEKESSLRMILNFGHTFGHAIERLTHYKKYLHGEAIGIGMALAARLSEKFGFCSRQASQEVIDGIASVGLPTQSPKFTSSQWIRALEVDKKSREGKIHFVFMKQLGDVVVEPHAARKLVSALNL